MKTVKLLDCTLRDGGYINNWEFGKDAITDITRKLEKTNIEILELGFLKNEPYDKNRTVFNDISQVKKLIGHKKPGINYAVMVEVVNPLPLENLAPADEEGPDIIRVIVWKRMLQEGFEYCKGIVEKGYKICVQPARVSQYSDDEFISMINLFKQLNPLAIYVVDSWGTMYKDQLLHYLKLADENMSPDIAVGYHGHNNMMQAFDVACAFTEQKLKRNLIIDTSIYGIGRGAGNLNTELFCKYMNEKKGASYDLLPVMEIFDSYISKIHKEYKWGYSIPYFISAKYNCNPNYASYYEEQGYTAADIEKCIAAMSPDERIIFDKEKANSILAKLKIKKKLCVILVTANKYQAVEGFLDYSAEGLKQLNIDLIVFDSSNDDSTKIIVKEYSKKYGNIVYDRYTGEYDGLSIDQKVLSAYRKYSDTYEYMWAIRDGLVIRHDGSFDGLYKCMAQNKDIIVVDLIGRSKLRGKTYRDCKLLFKEQVANMNTLGLTVVNSEFIKEVMDKIPLSDKTYGMYLPIAFFHFYASHPCNAILYISTIWCGNTSRKANRNHFWCKNFLWQWGERWYKLIDNLPSIYDDDKKKALVVKTADFSPFSMETILQAKKCGNIKISQINKYKEYLKYVCEIPLWKLYIISCLPTSIIKRINNLKRRYFHFLNRHIYEKKK